MSTTPDEEYNFLSSGDPQKDTEFRKGFVKRTELLAARQCPNGCGGLLVWKDGAYYCSQCHFVHVRSIVKRR